MSELIQRLELKYVLDEAQAARVRSDVERFCVRDENQDTPEGYLLTSLYLDTPSFAFHEAKMRRDADRLKLRVRSYDETGPVFLEVKRKTVDVVRKTRIKVPRAGWGRTARAGRLTGHRDPRGLEYFAQLAAQWGAEPVLLVEYRREAYRNDWENYARVTFDRSIRVQPQRDWSMRADPAAWCEVDPEPSWPGRSVILELKCETFMPAWMGQLIELHGLRRSGFSKYSRGVQMQRLLDAGGTDPQWAWVMDA